MIHWEIKRGGRIALLLPLLSLACRTGVDATSAKVRPELAAQSLPQPLKTLDALTTVRFPNPEAAKWADTWKEWKDRMSRGETPIFRFEQRKDPYAMSGERDSQPPSVVKGPFDPAEFEGWRFTIATDEAKRPRILRSESISLHTFPEIRDIHEFLLDDQGRLRFWWSSSLRSDGGDGIEGEERFAAWDERSLFLEGFQRPVGYARQPQPRQDQPPAMTIDRLLEAFNLASQSRRVGLRF